MLGGSGTPRLKARVGGGGSGWKELQDVRERCLRGRGELKPGCHYLPQDTWETGARLVSKIQGSVP